MADDRIRINAATPFHIAPIPGGARWEMDGLRRQVVDDVLAALLDTNDTTCWDQLTQLANTPAGTPLDETRLPYEELVDQLAERSSYRVPLYGRDRLLEVARVLRVLAIRIPGQQDRRAS